MPDYLVSVVRVKDEHRATVREVEAGAIVTAFEGGPSVGVASNETAAIVAAFAERRIRSETER